ncbi:hypothetical protein AMECASPLE_027633 [Ameca splendens]|uniref:Uncharacterized protein n=1 Tax=Ameca splendens TaxID=208324 RepID=A0ABV0ZSU6_9TELE
MNSRVLVAFFTIFHLLPVTQFEDSQLQADLDRFFCGPLMDLIHLHKMISKGILMNLRLDLPDSMQVFYTTVT